MRKSPCGQRVVDPLGHGPQDLHRDAAGDRLGRRDRGEALLGDLVPPRPEVLVDVGDRGAAQAVATSCQPSPPRTVWRASSKRSPPSEVRSIPPTKAISPSTIDDLLVVAVHRALVRVQRAPDLRPVRELVVHAAHEPAARGEDGQRRAGPQQDADGDALGQVRQAARGAGARRRRVSARSRESRASPRRARSAGPRRSPPRSAAAPRAPSTSTSSSQPSRTGGSPAAHSRPSRAGRAVPVDRRGRCAVDDARPSRPRCGRRPSRRPAL